MGGLICLALCSSLLYNIIVVQCVLSYPNPFGQVAKKIVQISEEFRSYGNRVLKSAILYNAQ